MSNVMLFLESYKKSLESIQKTKNTIIVVHDSTQREDNLEYLKDIHANFLLQLLIRRTEKIINLLTLLTTIISQKQAQEFNQTLLEKINSFYAQKNGKSGLDLVDTIKESALTSIKNQEKKYSASASLALDRITISLMPLAPSILVGALLFSSMGWMIFIPLIINCLVLFGLIATNTFWEHKAFSLQENRLKCDHSLETIVTYSDQALAKNFSSVYKIESGNTYLIDTKAESTSKQIKLSIATENGAYSLFKNVKCRERGFTLSTEVDNDLRTKRIQQ